MTPTEVVGAWEYRKQYIGQLEILYAVAPFFTVPEVFAGREVLHFIDNTAAVFGIAKGYSSKPDSAKIIHAFHALNSRVAANIEFRWVASEANIADLPSRGDFALLSQWGAARHQLVVPSVDVWHSADDAMRQASMRPEKAGRPRDARGGRRGSK